MKALGLFPDMEEGEFESQEDNFEESDNWLNKFIFAIPN